MAGDGEGVKISVVFFPCKYNHTKIKTTTSAIAIKINILFLVSILFDYTTGTSSRPRSPVLPSIRKKISISKVIYWVLEPAYTVIQKILVRDLAIKTVISCVYLFIV